MFNNLAAEIARKGVKNNDFAEKVGIHPVTFSKKLNGKTDFTLKEVIRIIEYFNCEFTLNLFFERLEDAEISYCYQILKNHLKNECIKKNIDTYNKWFLKFLQERVNLLKLEQEKICIMETVIKFENIFSDCLNIIKGISFNKFDSIVFYDLNESSLIENNPNDVVDFLNLIINEYSLKNSNTDIYSLDELLTTLATKCTNQEILKNILKNIIQYCRNQDWAEKLLDEIQ